MLLFHCFNVLCTIQHLAAIYNEPLLLLLLLSHYLQCCGVIAVCL